MRRGCLSHSCQMFPLPMPPLRVPSTPPPKLTLVCAAFFPNVLPPNRDEGCSKAMYEHTREKERSVDRVGRRALCLYQDEYVLLAAPPKAKGEPICERQARLSSAR